MSCFPHLLLPGVYLTLWGLSPAKFLLVPLDMAPHGTITAPSPSTFCQTLCQALYNFLSFPVFKYSLKEIGFGFRGWKQRAPHQPLWGSALLPIRSQSCSLWGTLGGQWTGSRRGASVSFLVPAPSQWKYFKGCQKEGNCSFSLWHPCLQPRNLFCIFDLYI